MAAVSAADLRPLSTDRPDATESPYTVDAGHFQFELEIANLEHDGNRSTFNFAELNAKAGLDINTDVQFVVPVFSHEEGGAEGFGDMQIRVKHNFWGNDGGSTAFGIMSFIKLPTANGDLGNGEVEGGIIVPFSFDGPAGWSCGVMTEIDAELDDDGNGYHPVFVNSVTTSHDIAENAGVFFELLSIVSTNSGAHSEVYFNTGCTCEAWENFQLDGGVRVGLNDAATDFTPFVGMSVKY